MKSEKELLEGLYETNLEKLLALQMDKKFFARQLIKDPKNESIIKIRNSNALNVVRQEDMVNIIKEALEEKEKAEIKVTDNAK